MNKIYKKILFIMCTFIFVICNYMYGYSAFTRHSGPITGGYRYNYSDVQFSETARNIKRTQDDEYYYFDISQTAKAPFTNSNYIQSRNTYDNCSCSYFSGGYNVVSAPFSNIYDLFYQQYWKSDSQEEKSGLGYDSQNISYFFARSRRVNYVDLWTNVQNTISSYTINGKSYPNIYCFDGTIRGARKLSGYRTEGSTSGYTDAPTGTYQTYNIPKANTTDPDIPLTPVQILSKKCTCISVDYDYTNTAQHYKIYELTVRFDYKIKIKKEVLDVKDNDGNAITPFRYVSVVNCGNFNAGVSADQPYGMSLRGVIDLLAYKDCNHNWVLGADTTKDYHTMYCDKCEWTKKENHTLEYEYDGIEDNLCKCGYVNKVKYHFIINDDINTERIDILDSFEDYTKLEGGLKTGYTLNGYEKYEMQIATLSDISTTHTNLTKVRLSDCMTMTDKTGNYSTYYVAKYNPIHYFIKFNVKNNKNFALDSGLMPTQEFIYDEEKELFDNWIVNGYMVISWYDSEGFNHKLFDRKEKILNYTTLDNDTIEVFPYFDETCFYINYIYDIGELRGSNPQKISYFDNQSLAGVSTSDRTIVFSGWLFNDKRADINEIKNYITYQNQKVNLYAVYYVNEKANEVPIEGIDPSGRDYNKKGKKGILDDLSEIGDGLYTNKEYVEKFVAIASSSIIATKSEIATESIIIVPKTNNKRIIMLDTNYFIYEIPKVSGLERLMIIMKVNLLYTCIVIGVFLCLIIGYIRYMVTHPINETIGGINENLRNIKKYFKEWLQSKGIEKNTIKENDDLIDNENIDNIEG